MDRIASCRARGLVLPDWYSTASVSVAKLTEALTTPLAAFTVVSALLAQEAQFMCKTGKVCFTIVLWLSDVDIPCFLVLVTKIAINVRPRVTLFWETVVRF